MDRLITFLFLAFASIASLSGNTRKDILLDTGWVYRPISDPKWDVKDTPVTLPHTWNSNYIKGTTTYNREMMVYQRTLHISPEMKDKRLFLYFEGVNSVADVFINRRTVGQHKGGYTAFCLEITDAVKDGDNELQVWVSNAFRTDVLPISGDFNVYGGIHRPCHLIVTEQNCISPLFYASPGVFVHQNQITDKEAFITVETKLSLKDSPKGMKVKTFIEDAEGKNVVMAETSVMTQCVKQSMKIAHPRLWNGKKDPYLYKIVSCLYSNEKLIDKVIQYTGFRYFTVDPEKGFFLNGKPYELYGFNRHEDVEGKGSALTQADYECDMNIVRESGATVMRLAHYPHGEPIYNLCDQQGVILWSEIPLCGPGGYNFTGYLCNPDFEENARLVTKEMVYQKYNHPSICFWGIFNEILVDDDTFFKSYDNPIKFIKELHALYKEIDSQRLTTFATCVDHSFYSGSSDLIAWNKYFYGNDVKEKAASFIDQAKRTSEGQAIGISEYGAGASVKRHCDPKYEEDVKTNGGHSEELQAIIHEKYWHSINERPYLWTKMIWQLSDMQSSFRKEGDRHGINNKGLVTYNRDTKKDAFYFYKANWNPEPMLWLCSRRFTERTYAVTDIKAYCNMDKATLFVNGKKIATIKQDKYKRLIWKNVELREGQNQIKIIAQKGKLQLEDSCIWNLKQ